MNPTIILNNMIDKLPAKRATVRYVFGLSVSAHQALCHHLKRNVKSYKGHQIIVDIRIPKDHVLLAPIKKRYGN